MAISTIDLDLEPMPAPPSRKDWQIGCIGAGFIMADVQIPAYLAAGFPIAAIASRTEAHARAVAERHGIETVHAGWRELLDDERIQVVDIAFPPDQQLRDRRGGLPAGPHQGHPGSEADRRELRRGPSRRRGVVLTPSKILAVNQNMRYDQSMRALKTALDRGYLGEPVLATIEPRPPCATTARCPASSRSREEPSTVTPWVPGGTAISWSSPRAPCRFDPSPCLPRPARKCLLPRQRPQVAPRRIADEDHVPPVPTVAAIGPAPRHMRLPPERDAPVPARATFHKYLRLVVHQLSRRVGPSVDQRRLERRGQVPLRTACTFSPIRPRTAAAVSPKKLREEGYLTPPHR